MGVWNPAGHNSRRMSYIKSDSLSSWRSGGLFGWTVGCLKLQGENKPEEVMDFSTFCYQEKVIRDRNEMVTENWWNEIWRRERFFLFYSENDFSNTAGEGETEQLDGERGKGGERNGEIPRYRVRERGDGRGERKRRESMRV